MSSSRALRALPQVPLACALTPTTAVAGSPLLRHMTVEQPLPDWTALAVFLAQLRAHHNLPSATSPAASPATYATPPDLARGSSDSSSGNAGDDAATAEGESGLDSAAAAAWQPYAAALPTAVGSVLEWPEDLRRGMEHTAAAELAEGVCRTADEAWEQVRCPTMHARGALPGVRPPSCCHVSHPNFGGSDSGSLCSSWPAAAMPHTYECRCHR